MPENKQPENSSAIDRRELVRKGAKAIYVAPLVLAAVKASERPAYGQVSGAPVNAPV